MQRTEPARGMRDFLPDDVRRREYVIGIIKRVYERYGFEPLETPAVENIETLLGKYGEEGNQLIFKILKRGEHEASGQADLALRYDLTVPLARVVAQYQSKLPRLFKRYQIQPVWRADRPARGRFREFYQCDVDSLGSTSPIVEAELCAAVSDALLELRFNDFVIRINHRQLLTSMLNSAGVPNQLHGTALVALDKLDKIGRDGVAREFASRGIPDEAGAKALAHFVDHQPFDILGHAHSAVANLIAIQELCKHTPADGRLRIDSSLARGLSYYTGAIMEIAVPDLAGSLGGGGRYDNLVGMFLGRDVPACGFSLGLERIIVVMTERNMFPQGLGGAVDVIVTLWNEASQQDALGLAGELRSGGLRVELYPEPDKLGKQFKYASSRNVPFVTIVGDDEKANGTVGVKDMRSGEQQMVARADVTNFIKSRVRVS
jgi:histidyl-tRNA synthetase